MPASFTALPAEIRNGIYGYLFDEECRIRLTYDFGLRKGYGLMSVWGACTLKPRLCSSAPYCKLPPQHPALVRTCRQIYSETILLLYTNKVFCHYVQDTDNSLFRKYNTLYSFPERNLRMVQKFEIQVARSHQTFSHTMTELMVSLREEALNLQQLHLIFEAARGASEGDSKLWIETFAYCNEIPKFIANSRALQYVCIRVCEGDKPKSSEGDEFLPFIQAIATKKGWVYDDEGGQCSRVVAQLGGQYERAWHLRPCTNESKRTS